MLLIYHRACQLQLQLHHQGAMSSWEKKRVPNTDRSYHDIEEQKQPASAHQMKLDVKYPHLDQSGRRAGLCKTST
ncbi:hypothetical protein GOP47_0011591 [Adiantum capillus-veneris]|uniref:Uncharacterized protein n=1 Tax=Adiantum capillus-veneris TaxID=13818 RepID=A0A9D4UUG5_ADICA|nr:hypothetical protein GOP47_0011591 [Adiantum capillus-veneris]